MAIRAPRGSCSTSSSVSRPSGGSHMRSKGPKPKCASAACRRCWQPGSRAANNRKGLTGMAELTNLESKLGEVLGLAMAAQGATKKVKRLPELDDDLAQTLDRMHEEAKEAERRATEVAAQFEGKKTAILEEALEDKQKATEMMEDYLDQAADALDGFEFLTMAEAGEVGHWEILRALNERARNSLVQELCEWALPIQQRHFEEARQGAVQLASDEDPNEPSE